MNRWAQAWHWTLVFVLVIGTDMSTDAVSGICMDIGVNSGMSIDLGRRTWAVMGINW